MTTLPQTTPTRMPRTVAPGQIAIPGLNTPAGNGVAYAPAAAAAAPVAQSLTGGDVWRVLRSNWWLLAIMLAVGAVGGYFLNRYLLLNYPHFTATGLVRIQTLADMNPGPNSSGGSRDALEVEQQSQTSLLLGQALLTDVLLDPNSKIRQTQWFQQFKTASGYDVERAKDKLAKMYEVSPISNSRLLRASVTWSIPEDTRIILTEIVEKHIFQQQQDVTTNFQKRAGMLDRQRVQLDAEWRDASQRLSNKARLLGPDGSVMGQSTIKTLQLSDLMRERAKLRQDFEDAEGEYQSMANTVQKGEAPSTAHEMARRDQLYVSYRMRVDELDVALRSEMTKGTDNNAIQSLQKQRQGYQDKADNRLAEVETQYAQDLLSEAQSKRDRAAANLKRIETELTQAQQEIGKLSAELTEYAQLVADEKDKHEKLNKITDELDEIARQRIPLQWSPAQWAQKPLTPETPSFPRLPVTVGVSVMLCLGLGLGIAFLRELTDTTVRSPRDIQRVGQMNLLGTVPHEADDPQAAGARIPLVIFDAPYSMAAEEYRRIRTRLQHMASLDTTRSILVTGAGAGDGKTSVACNLAAGLALNGRRILLVDANFRRPGLDKVFGLENGAGFGDLLNAPEYFDTVVRETPIPNLSVVTVGTKPSNVTELLESQLLIDFIERALDEYDHVIFDCGSVLMASETLAMAPRVDGVITVVRARANNRGVLQRMRETLRQVKAEHLGVVLNAVRAQAGGYYGRSILDYYKYSNGHANGNGAAATTTALVNGNGAANGN